MRPHIRHVIRSAPTEPPPPPSHTHTHVASPTMSGRTLCVHDAFCWGFALLRAPYSMCCFCFSECMKIRLTVLAHTRTHTHTPLAGVCLNGGDASSVVSTHRNRIKIIMFVSACSLLHTHTTNHHPPDVCHGCHARVGATYAPHICLKTKRSAKGAQHTRQQTCIHTHTHTQTQASPQIRRKVNCVLCAV